MSRLLLAAAVLVLASQTLAAQAATSDSSFTTGSCPTRLADAVDWNVVVTDPDIPAQPTRESTIPYPLHLRGSDGIYKGRVVVAMIVDESGRVVLGSISIMESTDPKLSAWICTLVGQRRFAPATKSGRAVASLFQMPYRYDGRPLKHLLPP